MKKLNIGLFGFGVVGEGIYQVLESKTNLGLNVKKIVIRHPEKSRNAPSDLFSTDADSILEDASIDVVVELIDDSEKAFEIVSKAMNQGKAVVSGNKKMIAENLNELLELKNKNKVSFLYEAAVCGSIPVLRNLEEYFDNDLLQYVKGIVNGSTNYILTRMEESGLSFEKALSEAQEKGFAESNPAMDVEGFDATFKLILITLHAFGKIVNQEQVFRKGISALNEFDFSYAKEKGLKIKLLANSSVDKNGEIESLSVLPTFVSKNEVLSSTDNEYNGVLIGSKLSDEQFLKGKGAGRFPTSSAVLSDLSALKYNYQYGFKKGIEISRAKSVQKADCKIYLSCDNRIVIPSGLFSKIDESFNGKSKKYLIGDVSLEKLRSRKILENQDFSIVKFES